MSSHLLSSQIGIIFFIYFRPVSNVALSAKYVWRLLIQLSSTQRRLQRTSAESVPLQAPIYTPRSSLILNWTFYLSGLLDVGGTHGSVLKTVIIIKKCQQRTFFRVYFKFTSIHTGSRRVDLSFNRPPQTRKHCWGNVTYDASATMFSHLRRQETFVTVTKCFGKSWEIYFAARTQ